MTKHFNRPQFAPRPTKGALVAAAKKQVAANEAKAKEEPATLEEAVKDYQQAKEEFKELVALDKGEVTAADVAAVQEVINDAAAASPTKPDTTPPVETGAAAASPATVENAQQTTDTPTAPAPAATASTTNKTPKGTNPTGLYALGKRYSPKTDRNSETWGKICKALADGPKTMKELTEVVKGHGDFLGYMTRGGHIVPHKVEQVSG